MDPQRLRLLTDEPTRPDGDYVLYWMTATRRLGWNFALDQALAIASSLGKPLLIFEALRVDYPWASDRHHWFVIDGMVQHARDLAGSPVGYFPYVEPEAGHGSGLLAALSADACVLVTDDSPVFFTPDLLRSAARLPVRVEAVDSCGLLPIRAPGKPFSAAYHFRRYLQRELHSYLGDMPSPSPLDDPGVPPFSELPDSIVERWRPARLEDGAAGLVASLPIDHTVPPVPLAGGSESARRQMRDFVTSTLSRYATDRNEPDHEATSGLSPWLHYGHLSAHELFMAIAEQEEWSPTRLSHRADGRREGWWGMSPSAEAYLDQLVTWRELGFGFCAHVPDYASYASLPEWARATLGDHASDTRPHIYSLDRLVAADTHDELWNAAQRQLVGEGVVHNYLRMLWGKKLLTWTRDPEEALSVMVELNNRFAIDGRDPNSYSGITWCLGRFDRGWPERPIFGKVRSMTSASTRRKRSLEAYLERWGPTT